MAMENKRITQLSTERLNLTSGDYVMVDDADNGSAKYRLDRLKETDNTLSVSGKAADAAATGQAISDETEARENADKALDEDIDDLKSAISTESLAYSGAFVVAPEEIIRGGSGTDGSPTAATTVIRAKKLYYLQKGSSLTIKPGVKCAKVLVSQYSLDRTFVKYVTPTQAWEESAVTYISDIDALYVFMFMSSSGELTAEDYDGSITIFSSLGLNHKHNVVAYVSGNSISWANSGLSCSVTIGDNVIIKSYNGTLDANTEITKADILSAASAYDGTTVDGNTISGNAFAIYYDWTDKSVKVGNTALLDTFRDSTLLFYHHWGSVTTGELVLSSLTYKVNGVYDSLSKKGQNSVAYVSDNALSWAVAGNGCAVTIGGDVVVRTQTGTTDSAVSVSKSSILSAASAFSGTSVSGDTITGNSFCLYYDFDSSAVKVGAVSDPACYGNTCVLFLNHWRSVTTGELINSIIGEKLNEITAAISGLDSRVLSLESKNIPSFLSGDLDTAVSELIQNGGEKSLVIVFTTDNHYGGSNGMNWPQTVDSIRAVNENYPVDAVINGGDAINGDETKATDIARIKEIVSDVRSVSGNAFTLVGNHDDGSFTAEATPYLSASELYSLFGRHMVTSLDDVSDSKAYGYKDFHSAGIRIILLDSHIYTGDNGATPATWGYDLDQIEWLRTKALDTNYQVAIFSHMGVTGEYSPYGVQPVNGVQVREVIENFISGGGVVVALFHGHTHWDFIGKYSQTNGFYEVSTGCGRIVSGPIPSSLLPPTGATMALREAGTETQELYDIIVIKPKTRIVNMVRFGAGESRNFSY